ncbi:MAG TPA: hypothetical protein VGM93_03430 [Acidimicrobiales bacterium]
MHEPGHGGRRAVAGLALAIVALVAVVRLPSFVHQLYDPDEAAIAAQAISVRDGGTLYVDAADRKPPLPPLLYAASFRLTGSDDLRPLHGLAAVALAGAALVLALDTRRRHGDAAGWWAAALMVGGAVAFLPQDAQAANYAHLALLPGALAVVWARRGTWWSAPAAGVALGAAILCRQSWFIGVVPGALAVALSFRGRGRAAVVAVAGFLAASVATVAAIGFAVPFWDFWRWTFTDNGGFVTSSVAVGRTVGAFAATVGIFVGLHLTLVALAAVAGRRRVGQAAAWRDDVDLWLWLAVGLLAVVAGFRFFGHYWLQALPPVVLLTAPVAAGLAARWKPWAIGGVALPAAVAFGFAWTPSTFRTLPDPRPLARYVRAHSAPGQPIWIWGSFPEVYLAADRPPGGALVHSDFVTGLSGGRAAGPATLADATPGAERQLLAELRAHPPALVIDTSTAGLRHYGHYPLRDFPALDRYLRAHYDKVALVDGSVVWAPKPR